VQSLPEAVGYTVNPCCCRGASAGSCGEETFAGMDDPLSDPRRRLQLTKHVTTPSPFCRVSAVGRLPMMMVMSTESIQSQLEVAKRVVWSGLV
jgi:hypothetical protein